MKKLMIFSLVALCLAVALCSCGKATTGGEAPKTENKTTSLNEMDEVAMFVKPADAISLDLSKEDPSTDQMALKYDEQGRVSQCYYSLQGKEVFANYEYSEDSVQIYTFIGSIVVDDVNISLSAYDTNKGFAIIDGYYFKGYSTN